MYYESITEEVSEATSSNALVTIVEEVSVR